jgi:nucleoside-diphosphate-sugar epimerase
MERSQRVLMTGHRGYVGSVMAPIFKAAGHEVVGFDADFYVDCDLLPIPAVEGAKADIRDVTADDLRGFDAVVHLAALSNDPIGNLNPEWTEAINRDGTRRVAEAAREAGVRRFLFASSCIMYGMAEGGQVDENSPLNPQTTYARSKVEAEQDLVALAGDDFSPVLLRNGTMYGVSPRMRFDTVLNSLTGWAVTTGKISIMGDGEPWRPVVHVGDVSRAFLAALEAPLDVVHGQAFNVGADHLNVQVRDLAAAVQSAVHGAQIEILAQPDADQRTYRTSFAKFAGAFPEFRFEHDIVTGAVALADTLRDLNLTFDEFSSDRFTRLKRLDRLISEGRLDGALRWRVSEAA